MGKGNAITVSIITLNYKEALLTKRCVQSLLLSKNISFEIIIVDNSSSKKDTKILRSIKSSKVRLFTPETNLGCARGYNLGIQEARGKYVFIVNNDTLIADKNALSAMAFFIGKNPRIAVLQPKIKSLRKRKMYEYAGAAGGYLDLLGYPFCRGRIFSTLEEDVGQYEEVVDIAWASTCAFFAKKEILYKAGLFDPIYFAYAEEVDISLRIRLLGYLVVYFPKAEIFHKGEASWKKTRGRKTYLIHRNHLILYLKCLPARSIFFNLPYRVALEYISIVYYIFNKGSFHIFFVLLSHLNVLFISPLILIKRKQFFKNTTGATMSLYSRSIVADYFFRKRKHFSELEKSDFKNYKV